MKKTLFLLAAIVTMVLVTPNRANAQNNILTENGIMAQATIGFPLSSMSGKCVIPPVSATMEYCIADFNRFGSLSVGGTMEYALNNNSVYDYNLYINDVVLEALVCYHYSFNPRFAAHVKFGAGYWNGLGVGAHLSRSARAGVTYLLNDHVGVVAEAGYSYVSTIRVGIAFRF